MERSDISWSRMMKDIIEENWIRNFGNPGWFCLKLVFALITLFGGTKIWVFTFFVMIDYLFFFSRPHIEYIVPVSDTYREKRIIIKIFTKAVACVLLLAAGTGISVLLFQRKIYGRDIFLLIIHICALLIYADSSLTVSRKFVQKQTKSSGKKREIIGSIILVCAEVIVTVLALRLFNFGKMFSLAMKLDFAVSDEYMVIMLIIMVFLLADIIYKCKRYGMGDYQDFIV